MFVLLDENTLNDGVLNDRPPDPREPDKSIFNTSQLPILEDEMILTVGIEGSTALEIEIFIEEEFRHSLQGIDDRSTHLAFNVDSLNVNKSPTFNNEPVVPGYSRKL